MDIYNVIQGSQEWHDLRAKYPFTASLAPTIMGEGYDSRDKAMRIALGVEVKEITPHLQTLFNAGHQSEEDARPTAEKHMHQTLSPLVGVREIEGMFLLASFDGINFDQDIIWEHKNTSKTFDEIPPLYYWQLESQMLVANCNDATLTVTDRNTSKLRHYNYESHAARRDELISGWKQWQKDLDNYERTDTEWLDLAESYRDLKTTIDNLTKQQKEISVKLQSLAGGHSAIGGGIKLSVSEKWTQKQTAAAYIKEHEIVLPEKQLKQAKLNYRITVEKAA